MDQGQQPRERSFINELVPDWRLTQEQVLWTVRIVVVLVVVLTALTLIGLPFKTTLWDWLDLLIVPVVLALGGYLFTRSENRRTQEIATQHSENEVLTEYLEQMGQMLLDEGNQLRESSRGDEVRKVARVRTLTALRRLDAANKEHLLEFLKEAELIEAPGTRKKKEREIERMGPAAKNLPIISLQNADLHNVKWHVAALEGSKLGGANLRNADLRFGHLTGAWLEYANLSGARLWRARCPGAHLSGAILNHAELDYAHLSMAVASAAVASAAHMEGASLFHTFLQGADLRQANLRHADLEGAHLTFARLDGADLTNARNTTDDQLGTCKSLTGATMPNGQKYEDWLKDKKAREETGKNPRSS